MLEKISSGSKLFTLFLFLCFATPNMGLAQSTNLTSEVSVELDSTNSSRQLPAFLRNIDRSSPELESGVSQTVVLIAAGCFIGISFITLLLLKKKYSS